MISLIVMSAAGNGNGDANDVRAARVEFAVPASDRAAPESTFAFEVTPRGRTSLVSDVLTAHNSQSFDAKRSAQLLGAGARRDASQAAARLSLLGSSDERRSPTPTPSTFGGTLHMSEAADIESESLVNAGALTARTLDTAVLLDQNTEQLMQTLAQKKRARTLRRSNYSLLHHLTRTVFHTGANCFSNSFIKKNYILQVVKN